MLSNHTPFQEKPSPSIRRKFCKRTDDHALSSPPPSRRRRTARPPRALWRARPEAVLGPPADRLQEAAPSRARRLPPLGLLAPVICALQSGAAPGLAIRRTLSDAGGRVSAGGTCVLLDVEGPTAWANQSCSAASRGEDEPQRRQRVCVLLWRLPKLDVPFAVGLLAGQFSFPERLRRTHGD